MPTFRAFLSYSREDASYRDEFMAQIAPIGSVISVWTDQKIKPGAVWASEIRRQLNNADLVVLLVSVDFLKSKSCIETELERALKLREQQRTHVVPIIIRPCVWELESFSHLQALRADKPISKCEGAEREQAWVDVVRQISDLLASDEKAPDSAPPSEPPPVTRNLRKRAYWILGTILSVALLVIGATLTWRGFTTDPWPNAITHAPPSDAEPSTVELAIRWRARESTIATVEVAAREFGMTDVAVNEYDIRYFDPPASTKVPDKFRITGRLRTSKKNKSQFRLKYRGEYILAGWHCPMPPPAKTQLEADITFLANRSTIKLLSYSCSVPLPEPPATLQMIPRQCSATMKRIENDDLTLEEWRLSDGDVLIEVSRRSQNTETAVVAFQKDVVDRLGTRINPLADRKAELGCP